MTRKSSSTLSALPGQKTKETVSLFERMGPVYRLLVDERKRRAREEPLLLKIARSLHPGGLSDAPARAQTRILDLACGTGFHSRLFARAGYPVVALDGSASMLAQARRQGRGETVQYRQADLLRPIEPSPEAALTLLLGNTLSLFDPTSQLRPVLFHAARASHSRGKVLCQILNYERLRTLGQTTVTRHGRVRRRETVLTKTLQVLEDGRVLLMLAAAQERPGEADWETLAEASFLHALSPEELRKTASEAGLTLESEWGGLDQSPFQPATSSDYVALFRTA
jgi:SAM-dependent methyltransferase